MKRRLVLLTLAASIALSACGAADEAPVSKPTPSSAYSIGMGAAGFEVGQMMAANTAFVFFDPQCPHCAELWSQSQPLLGKVRFKWIPVGILRPISRTQGAVLLASKNPAKLMSEHEASIEARTGGISGFEATEENKAKVDANTLMFRKLGATGVPYLVFRNAKSGEYGVNSGAANTAQLLGMLGL